MANPTYATFYIRNENIGTYNQLVDLQRKSDFINWCLKNKFEEYKEQQGENDNEQSKR